MKRKLALVALGILLSLSALMAACAPQVDKSNYTGEWELAAGSTEGLDADTIALARSLGSNATLSLSNDDTGYLNLYGDTSTVTWTAKSDTEGTLQVEGAEESTMKLEDGKLVIYDKDGGSLTFVRP